MPAKRDKTTGLPLPSPVVPSSNICVQLLIPNAPEYVQAFRGVLAELGKYWTWRRTVGQSDDDARAAAELWRGLLQYITYSEDCEDHVSCIDITNCISTNAGTRDAITQTITSGPGQTNVYNTTVLGSPMTAAQRNTPIAAPNDGCDEDQLFGSITEVVHVVNRNNMDFLELLLLSDNNAERISKIIKAIPLLNEVPIDEMIDFASQMMAEIKENYDAQYTTALEDTYRCELFCLALASPDCNITFDILVKYFNDRIGTALEPLNFFQSLVTYFVAGTWSGTQVVDIMSLIQLSAWQQASNWLGVSLRTLQTVGLLGANNPDHDWAVIPCTCAAVEGFVAYGTSETTVSRVGNVYTITGGFVNAAHTASFIYIGKSIDGAAATGTMAYTSLSIIGVTAYDWGDNTSSNTTTPPNSAPPPDVRYAGGSKLIGPVDTMQIVIETTMPFQGILSGS